MSPLELLEKRAEEHGSYFKDLLDVSKSQSSTMLKELFNKFEAVKEDQKKTGDLLKTKCKEFGSELVKVASQLNNESFIRSLDEKYVDEIVSSFLSELDNINA